MTAAPSLHARLAEERATLAKAERDIVDGERQITEQTIRILTLKVRGQATEHADWLLTTMQDTLAQWYVHRAEIQDTIQRLQAEGSVPSAGG